MAFRTPTLLKSTDLQYGQCVENGPAIPVRIMTAHDLHSPC